MRINKYYLAAITAFAMWGFFSLALKPIHHYPSLDILFYRVFLSVMLISAINLFIRKNVVLNDWKNFQSKPKSERGKMLRINIGGGLLLTANWFIFIYVMNHISVKAASFAYLVCPILTTVLAFFILKEKLSKWQWMAVGISVTGCVLLSFNSFADIFYSLIVALTYALYLVFQRKNTEVDKFVGLNIQLLTSGILLLPFFPSFSGPVPAEGLFYICLIFIVVMFTIIPLFLNLFALKGVNSSSVGIMLYINPIINFLLAVFYYREEVTEIQMISYSLILISIIVFNEKLIFNRKLKELPVSE
ncbi:permease [Flavobacterium suncheonense GH29-5 = DSM 17707]|uniref:Permease n=2 Tax=Flavobacterium suncheonense TaxID=350894 RepID=A0A0A2MGV6_9FLAO|nr:EamA family transporter [Flavobacterium suncheonense]KGO90653.1 permease [Flavobacterium suncheonense GH29-5 = DSM 17707]